MDFLHDELGQDITEYSLLLAFVVMASAALLITSTSAIVNIWSASNQIVVMANSTALSGTS
jgi:Flp pilus assembly pilin Flp